MKTFLSLGSNIGDRYENLKFAINELDAHPHIWIINKSYLYETEPMYFIEQDAFYNMVIEIDTNLEPLELLDLIKKIEVNRGRKKTVNKNMPRVLDIDILTIGDLYIRSETLNIPHKRFKERKFVLKPWNDIAGDFLVINENRTVNELLKKTSDKSVLKMILDVKGFN